MSEKKLVEISGAGPAGLAAAILVQHKGGQARVYERRDDVGGRFHGDFQGLENWTTKSDALQELASIGIQTNFEHTAYSKVSCFGPQGASRVVQSRQPLFYLVRRGSDTGTLDTGLKQQALDAGVDIQFGHKARHLPDGGLVAEGPHRADAIATGYVFETDMPDGAFVAVSDQWAARGYSYLLICNGRATLATCLFDDFHNEQRYLDNSVALFEDRTGIKLQNPRKFGGSGNFSLPGTARKGKILYAGEAAGFQDPLFGFGIRSALISGALAGGTLLAQHPERYEQAWKRRLKNRYKAAATNRWFYNRMGDSGYRRLIQGYDPDSDIRERLHRDYAPSLWKNLWYDLIVARSQKPVLNPHEGCLCTWCRCASHMA